MRKLILLTLLGLAGFSIPKNSSAQVIQSTLAGDSVQFRYFCLDSTGSVRACDSVWWYLTRITPATGVEVFVDSGRSTSPLAVFGGAWTRYRISDAQFTGLTVGRHILDIVAWGGTFGSQKLTTPVSYNFSVGIDSSGIVSSSLADNVISAPKVAADAIGASEIATDAITAAEIATDAIAAAEIAANAIGSSEIATDAITSAELAPTAASEIVDSAWAATRVDGAAGRITAGSFGAAIDSLQDIGVKILTGGIVAGSFASGAIDAAAIATDAIGAAEIATAAITQTEVAPDYAEQSEVANLDGWNPITDNDSLIVDNSSLDRTGYSLSAADKQVLRDSLMHFMGRHGPILPNPSFEMDDSTAVDQNLTGWKQGTLGAVGGTADTAHPSRFAIDGRWSVFLNGRNTAMRSDSFYLTTGRQYYMGGWVWSRGNNSGASIEVTIGNTTLFILSFPQTFATARTWQWLDTTFSVTSAGVYHFELGAGTGGGDPGPDSTYIDGVQFYAMGPDTSQISRAVWDNDVITQANRTVTATATLDSSLIWRLLQHSWGKPTASYDGTYTDGDSLTVAQRTVTASGGVTVSFHSGTGNRTVTITTVDSAGGYPAVPGAFVTVVDSTSHLVVGNLPSNSSGITVFTLNDGGYYIKTSKPGYRPIYGSSPSPQDSIYLRVSGATSRTDTIEGVAQILPVVAGKTNFYGYIQDLQGDSLVDGAEVVVEYDNPPNKIECCTTDTSATVTIPKFSASLRPNINGRWEINIYPTSSLIPNLKYKVTLKVGGESVFTKSNITISGASQRFNP